jgi:superoxide reductase
MAQERKFYVCKLCGNIVVLIHDGGGTLSCCGQPMQELVANTSDGATEKHVPVIEAQGNKVTVKVGSVTHPMLPEHFIQWIYLQTQKGGQRVDLHPGEEPLAHFILAEGDKIVAAYEYCNLHGLWKA